MPRVQMTRSVKFALYFLRVYLLILLTLIVLKFVRVFAAKPAAAPRPPESSQTHD